MAEETRFYSNLDYLKGITGDNPDLFKEFVQEGLQIVQESMESIQKAVDNKDFTEIARVCHMLKSSMKIFGSDFIEEKLALLEKVAGLKEEVQTKALTTEVLQLLDAWKKEVGDFT